MSKGEDASTGLRECRNPESHGAHLQPVAACTLDVRLEADLVHWGGGGRSREKREKGQEGVPWGQPPSRRETEERGYEKRDLMRAKEFQVIPCIGWECNAF